jgi:hypothetical protein
MKRTLVAIVVITIACTSAMQTTTETSADPAKNILLDILNGSPELQAFTGNKDSLNIQIIYTRIDRDSRNEPHFTDYIFNVDPKKYFYPASTVKMPVAFLALEKISELQDKGIDKYTTMITDSSFSGQEVAYTQPMAEDSKACVAHFVKQIFLVSDNEANNRLYELLGQEYLNDQLRKKGFNNSYIRHRLSSPLNPEQNRHTNAVSFVDTAGNILYDQPAQYSTAVFPAFNDKLGTGYLSGGKLVNEPFDFSLKNHVALADLHQVLRAMLFPGAVKKNQRFNVSEDDRNFLLKWMSSFPRESNYPYYDTTEYPDDYVKFLGRGILPNPNIRIFSKSGWAYGFLTDIAYVADFEHNVEFQLSATILCNGDGIFNDDKYEFETVGYPFMSALGKAVYRYELKRQRKLTPDLSGFRFDYSGK